MPKIKRNSKASTPKKVAAVETSESIAKKTAEFLDAGGKIEVVERGVSGWQQNQGKQHITFAKK